MGISYNEKKFYVNGRRGHRYSLSCLICLIQSLSNQVVEEFHAKSYFDYPQNQS